MIYIYSTRNNKLFVKVNYQHFDLSHHGNHLLAPICYLEVFFSSVEQDFFKDIEIPIRYSNLNLKYFRQ